MLLKPQFFQNYENFLGKACHFITVLLSFSFQKNLEAKQTNKKKEKQHKRKTKTAGRNLSRSI